MMRIFQVRKANFQVLTAQILTVGKHFDNSRCARLKAEAEDMCGPSVFLAGKFNARDDAGATVHRLDERGESRHGIVVGESKGRDIL